MPPRQLGACRWCVWCWRGWSPIPGQGLETRRRISEERLQIAHDLHDTVAHSMAAINVQAGVGAHLLSPECEPARRALEAVKESSGQALVEMHALLGLLRVDDDEGDDAGERSPTPDLRRLDELVASTRGAGLDVDVESAGSLADVSGARSVAADRIAQESLTNVIRHVGPPAAVWVAVDSAGGCLSVEIVDDGCGSQSASGASTQGSGVGIIGMRERAEMTGGVFDAGPAVGGGFRVQASWPVPE